MTAAAFAWLLLKTAALGAAFCVVTVCAGLTWGVVVSWWGD